MSKIFNISNTLMPMRLFIQMLFLLAGLSGTARAAEQEITAITVLADRALTVPLAQLASDYTRNRHISVSVAFSPSFEQSVAIESGELVDLFISAHPGTLEQLKKRGMFAPDSLTPLARTRLVLVTSSAHPVQQPLSIASFLKLRKTDNFLLATANPAAAAEGYYAEQVLKYLRRHMFLADSIVEMQNTSDITDFLGNNEGFGLMFESDALQAGIVRKVANIPDEWYHKPVFTAAIVAKGNTREAQKFLSFLQSQAAQRVLIKSSLYPVD